MLAGYAQRGAVFHEADVVDIRHFRAADCLDRPSEPHSQVYLVRCYQFVLNLFRAQGSVEQRRRKDVVQAARGCVRNSPFVS